MEKKEDSAEKATEMEITATPELAGTVVELTKGKQFKVK